MSLSQSPNFLLLWCWGQVSVARHHPIYFYDRIKRKVEYFLIPIFINCRTTKDRTRRPHVSRKKDILLWENKDYFIKFSAHTSWPLYRFEFMTHDPHWWKYIFNIYPNKKSNMFKYKLLLKCMWSGVRQGFNSKLPFTSSHPTLWLYTSGCPSPNGIIIAPTSKGWFEDWTKWHELTWYLAPNDSTDNTLNISCFYPCQEVVRGELRWGQWIVGEVM